MQTHSERGVALILALFLMAVLSVLAGSLMFLAQTETYATMNYRMMSQARYGAEAGVQKAANYLLTTYADPATKPVYTDLTSQGGALYDNSGSPVKYMGADVVLSTTVANSNYPNSAVKAAFSAAAQGALAAGNASVTYTAVATLLSMQTIDSYGGGREVIQTWQVVGDGTLAGARKGTVEVMATIESPKMVANPYAAFAVDPGCSALTIDGSPNTDSYNSNGQSGTTAPTLSGEGGDVGTNGNIDVTGTKLTVKGHLYSPRKGVGACVEGSTNMTALTQSGKADVSGSLVQLPKALPFATPTMPNPSPIAEKMNPSCTDLGLTSGTAAEVNAGTKQCVVSGSAMTINAPGASLPGVKLTGGNTMTLIATGPDTTYNFNSFTEAGSATIGVKVTAPGQSVVVKIVGKNPDSSDIPTPLNLSGNSYAGPDISACAGCYKYDASMLQFVYGGTGEITMKGNDDAAAVFYAPNAKLTVGGSAKIYGSLLGKTMDIHGDVNIYYDSNLQSKFFVPGNPVIGTFTWKRN